MKPYPNSGRPCASILLSAQRKPIWKKLCMGEIDCLEPYVDRHISLTSAGGKSRERVPRFRASALIVGRTPWSAVDLPGRLGGVRSHSILREKSGTRTSWPRGHPDQGVPRGSAPRRRLFKVAVPAFSALPK